MVPTKYLHQNYFNQNIYSINHLTTHPAGCNRNINFMCGMEKTFSTIFISIWWVKYEKKNGILIKSSIVCCRQISKYIKQINGDTTLQSGWIYIGRT